MKAAVDARVEEERANYGPPPNPFECKPCPGEWFREDPPPRKYLFDEVVPEGLVAGLGGSGGGGKTFIATQMAISAATGRTFGPFQPAGARPAMIVLLEDVESEARRRLHDIGKVWGLSPQHIEALETNLYVVSMVGRMRPLVELDAAGNPTLTETYYQLLEAVIKLGIRFLLVDPKSRTSRLDENRAEHAVAHSQMWEQMVAAVPGLVVLFTHHSPKGLSDQGRMSADTVFRGSSGLVDSIRWGAGLRVMTRADAEMYGVQNHRDYAELDLVKVNYAPQWPGPVYFERGPGGVLIPANLQRDRAVLTTEAFARALAEDGGEYSRRELSRSPGAGIRGNLKDWLPGWKASHLDRTIDTALRQGLVEEVQILAGPKSTPKLVLRPVTEPSA
ncbi:AAA family ATPase [Desulfoferula mesophila]